MPGVFKVDPTVTPKTIDVSFTEGPLKGRTHKGIYELTEDTYKVSMALEGRDRPTEFASRPGSGNGFQIMKRETTSGRIDASPGRAK
jgi:hypothetical protein